MWLAQLLTHVLYRLCGEGVAHVPATGAALVVCNHLSFADALLLAACLPRRARILVHRRFFAHPTLRRLLSACGAVAVSGDSETSVREAVDEAVRALQQGQLVCLFADGSVGRETGQLTFSGAFARIVSAVPVPVIPAYIDRVWGSLLAFQGGTLRVQRPWRLRFPVRIAFGSPLPSGTTATDARLALETLGADVAGRRHASSETLASHFIRGARARWRQQAMSDSTGRSLSFGRVLIGSVMLAKWLRRERPGDRAIGLLLPSTVGGALANLATTLAGKLPVNLNFTSGAEAMTHAVASCGITTILTSRQFLEKAAIAEMPGMVYLEDLLPAVATPAGKISALLQARGYPASWLARACGGGTAVADDTATIIFSSGSTGIPKGVMLSHRNILANLDAVEQIVEMRDTDVLIGMLPFFHSFGYTGTLWFPLLTGFAVVYHPNPMDAKTVGELAEKHRATMLISTPTFCLSYVRKCRADQFAHLRYAIVGAEKLREPVAHAFKEKFGVELIEGYGCTEMAPVVCANLPQVDEDGRFRSGYKPGSVGQPLPGVVAKIVDLDTGTGPIVGREGLLLVKGPNRMQGYLGDDLRTQEALQGDWYITGDIGVVDEDGYIYITDRLSRFSKIAGEMVPHMKVEEAIAQHLGDGHAAVVTSVPDDARGERLVALYTDTSVSPQRLWDALSSTGLPRLWIPKREDLRLVDAIPTLGSGKIDLRGARQLALDTASTPAQVS